MKTLQEVFDRIVEHARGMTEKSTSENEFGDQVCRYRGDNGNMCFVGALIDDEHYNFTLEGFSAYADSVLDALRDSGWDSLLIGGIVAELQAFHDYLELDAWENAFKNYAERNGLNYEPKRESNGEVRPLREEGKRLSSVPLHSVQLR